MQATFWIEPEKRGVYDVRGGTSPVCGLGVAGVGVDPVCMEGVFARADWYKPRLF